MWLRASLAATLRGPGKALWVASAIGWCALIWQSSFDRLHSTPALIHEHGGAGIGAGSHTVSSFSVMWFAMLLAMAPPLLLREIGYLWRSSLRRMRRITIACFICGYVTVWLMFGYALWLSIGWIVVTFERIAIAIGLILLWHCSPVRQRCLNACHRVPPQRLFGTAAVWDATRYGFSTGSNCTAACGSLMALILLTNDWHLIVMGFAMVLTAVERYLPGRRPAWQLPIVPPRRSVWPDVAV